MNNKELAFTPAWKLQQLIFSKEISPVELTELYFERINSLNSKLNAYLTLNYDDALKSAKSAETEIILLSINLIDDGYFLFFANLFLYMSSILAILIISQDP